MVSNMQNLTDSIVFINTYPNRQNFYSWMIYLELGEILIVVGTITILATGLKADESFDTTTCFVVSALVGLFGIANFASMFGVSKKMKKMKKMIRNLDDTDLKNVFEESAEANWGMWLQPIGWIIVICYVYLRSEGYATSVE